MTGVLLALDRPQILEKCLNAFANEMRFYRPRNEKFSALGAEQVTLASLLIFTPKLREFSFKSLELMRSEWNTMKYRSFRVVVFFARVCFTIVYPQSHLHVVQRINFSNILSALFTCSTDKQVRIWDMETGICVRRFRGHSSFVNSCHPVRRGPQMVCSASDDGTVRVWDQRQRDACKSFQCTYQVTSVSFNDTGEQIFSAGIDNDIKVWDMRKGNPIYTMFGHSDTVTGIRLSPDGSFLLSNAMDCSLRLWDVRPFAPEHRCLRLFQGAQHNFEKNLLRCSWSPDGNRISAGSSDRFVYVWDVTSCRILYKLPGHQGSVNETNFHPTEPIRKRFLFRISYPTDRAFHFLVLSVGSDKKIFLGELA
uniref:Uncharacterized protein n=1 Tax=Romanomermis culicivorax TaxID=13658 RepID=A0A915L4F1_ROMCU